MNSPGLNTVYYKIRAASLPDKVQGVNDLRRRLTDVQVEVEQRIIDNGIDHWRSRLHACIRATGHFEYSPRHKLAKTLLTARIEVKIYS